MTTREKLKKWTDNEELIGVLSYMSASKCQKPDEVSFLTTAMETDHLQDGAWYPKGGPCAISMSGERIDSEYRAKRSETERQIN